MSILKNDLLLKAANGEAVPRTPVWLMRQAGRILPEYRKLREKVPDFKTLLKTPELACQVTLMPVDILGVDAAILFSDILVVPEAMGLSFRFDEKKGPYFEKPVRTDADVAALKIPDAGEYPFVTDSIRLANRALNSRMPLIGFAGAPWTLFAYMVEGSGNNTFLRARELLYANPALAQSLLDKITAGVAGYLLAQVNAGVHLLQLFDTLAGLLPPHVYRKFALPSLQNIARQIHGVPLIVFVKGIPSVLTELAKIPCQVIGIDWTTNVSEAKEVTGGKTLQGNLDPALLYAETDIIKAETIAMLKRFGPRRHIANLGHGVYPDTPLDHVRCFIDTVKQYRFEQP